MRVLCHTKFSKKKQIIAGFPRLLESPGIFRGKFPGPGKSWKMTLLQESPGNLLARSWNVLKFARQWCAWQFLVSNRYVYAVENSRNCCHQVCFPGLQVWQKCFHGWGSFPDHTGRAYSALPFCFLCLPMNCLGWFSIRYQNCKISRYQGWYSVFLVEHCNCIPKFDTMSACLVCTTWKCHGIW